MVLFQVFSDPKVVHIAVFISVKLHVTGLLCKAKLTRLSVADRIVKNDFSYRANNYYSTYSLLCCITRGRGS